MTSKLVPPKQRQKKKPLTDTQIVVDEKTQLPQLVSRRVLEQRYVIPVARIMPFYKNLMKGRLVGTRCKVCGATYFPPRGDCCKCGSSDMSVKKLSEKGELVSFTKIFVKPSSFSQFPDYMVGVARMEGDLKVLSWLRGVQPDRVKVGMKVAVKIQKRVEDGALEYYLEPARA